ncbi:MAG TPA: STAS domain-containing protein [Acidimicrobiales bacterium]|jgi:anti-anti-sigma factor|nr:STAS domain-containing protein [Acidimicrobiales bacterium]
MNLPDEFDVRLEEGTAVVRPTGELDLATAPALRAALEHALRIAERAVLVDLAAVTFLDSTALAVFVETWRKASDGTVGFRLSRPAPNVRRVLAMTDLTGLLCPG